MNLIILIKMFLILILFHVLGHVTPTNVPSPGDLRHNNSQLSDYDSPNQSHKRARLSESWAT